MLVKCEIYKTAKISRPKHFTQLFQSDAEKTLLEDLCYIIVIIIIVFTAFVVVAGAAAAVTDIVIAVVIGTDGTGRKDYHRDHR